MQQHAVLGYSRLLYETLQQVGYLAIPYEPSDFPGRGERYWHKRERLKDHLLEALIGVDSTDPENHGYVTMLYEAIDDDVLLELVENGVLSRLFFQQPNYFVAIEDYG